MSQFASLGTSCGDDSSSACDAPDTCDGAGACQPNRMPADTACGDDSSSACDAPDTCDGAGACQPNHLPADTACGDTSSSACDAPDACDGSGTCQPNHLPAGTACGDANASQCDAADSCDGAGACGSNLSESGTSCYDCGSGAGGCDACASGVCADRPGCEESAQSGLATTFVAGNNHRGNMFDIAAAETVKIVSFDVSPMGNTDIEVYFRPGSHQGHETSSDGWTLIGSAAVSYTGGAAPLPLFIGVTIPAGETYAFYVTSKNVGVALNYSNGNELGAPAASDGTLTVMEGVGLEYPFTAGTNGVYTPRIWNGVVHYKLPETDPRLETTDLAFENESANGAMFDLVALQDVSLRALFLELAEGVYDNAVYFRRGSFVGFEDASTGWEPIGGGLGITSAGPATLTELPFSSAVVMSEGETIGLYIDFGSQAALRVNAAASVGALARATPELEWRVGRAFSSSFAGAGGPAVVRGAVQYPVCQ